MKPPVQPRAATISASGSIVYQPPSSSVVCTDNIISGYMTGGNCKVPRRWSAQRSQFRAANGRFEDAVEENALDGVRPVPFLCECADIECRGRIEITTSDYDAAHIDPDHYVILRGHPTIDGEEIVEDNVTSLVADKNRCSTN